MSPRAHVKNKWQALNRAISLSQSGGIHCCEFFLFPLLISFPLTGSRHGAYAQRSSRVVWNLVGLPGTVQNPSLSLLPLPFPLFIQAEMCAQGASKRQNPPCFASTLLWVPNTLPVCPSAGFAARAEGSWGKPAAQHPSRRKRWPLSPSLLIWIAMLTLGTVAKKKFWPFMWGATVLPPQRKWFALVLASHSLPGRLIGDLEWRGDLNWVALQMQTSLFLLSSHFYLDH